MGVFGRGRGVANEEKVRWKAAIRYNQDYAERVAKSLEERAQKTDTLPPVSSSSPEVLFGPPRALMTHSQVFHGEGYRLRVHDMPDPDDRREPPQTRIVQIEIEEIQNVARKSDDAPALLPSYNIAMRMKDEKIVKGFVFDEGNYEDSHVSSLLSVPTPVRDSLSSMSGVVPFTDNPIGRAVHTFLVKRYDSMLKQLSPKFLKQMGIQFTDKDYDSLQSQLAQLFPNVDPQGLEAVVEALDTGFDRLRKTTDQTFTGTVLDFVVNGQHIYGKISRDKERLRKEAAYHEDAWEHPALRVITPKLAGLVETVDMAGLFTYGTENRGIVAKQDVDAYMKLRKDAFRAYAQMAGRDIKELGNDPLMTDVFNRALAHASLWTYRGEGVYNTQKKPVVLPFEQVMETAHPTNGALKTLRGVERKYRTAENALAEAGHLLPITLLHRDAREENIFPTYLNPNPRPTGDFGNVQPGEPIFDLSRIEVDPRTGSVVDAAAYVRPYLFFRQFIEGEPVRQYQDTPTLEHMTRLASFTDAVRTLGTKIPRRDAQATRYYTQLAEGKAGMIS